VPPSAYRILVSRGQSRPKAQYFALGVRAPIPTVPIPLLPEDDEVTLELNDVLHDLINRARYYRRLHYDKPPIPPLSESDAAWAKLIIEQADPGSTQN